MNDVSEKPRVPVFSDWRAADKVLRELDEAGLVVVPEESLINHNGRIMAIGLLAALAWGIIYFIGHAAGLWTI